MIEVRIQSIIEIINTLPTTLAFKTCVPATTAQLIQTQITSALIAVDVSIDTAPKTTVKLMKTMSRSVM